MAGMLGVIQSINKDANGERVPKDQMILRIGPGTALAYPGRTVTATGRLLSNGSFWSLVGWIARNALLDVAKLPLRLVPSALVSALRQAPARVAAPRPLAERKLRSLRWTNLGINLWYQLELTRAQIPLQRLGKSIEHLTSIVALCWHASKQDESQQKVAALQAELLRDKFNGIRILTGLFAMDRLRGLVAGVGEDLEQGRSSLVSDIEPQPFAEPWD